MQAVKKELKAALSIIPGWRSSPRTSRTGTPSTSFNLERESILEEGSELCEFSLDAVKARRVNEVAERLEEITQKALEAEQRREQEDALEAAGVQAMRGLDIVGGAHVHVHAHSESRANSHDDNASTTLSTAETTNDPFWEIREEGSRLDERSLMVQHVVEKGDTVGGICVRYGVSVGQLLQANKAFSAQGLMARKCILVPNMMQMDM